jgi:adenine-specific DNA methylase
MSEESTSDGEDRELDPLAIEGKLPLKAVGIENLKEANPKHMPPHRYLHPWFARRPTPVARLAILSSVLPKDTGFDELLKLMQIGSKEKVQKSISEYVKQKKATESSRSGTLEDHYGYPRPFTQSPTAEEVAQFHRRTRDVWDQVPTVMDPTAGGGVIPYESIRYGMQTESNELNPVPSIILKVLLQYAPEVGSLREEVEMWGEKIRKEAQERLENYFPLGPDRNLTDSYISTYTIECPTCGSKIPLVPKWWIRNRKSARDVVVKPEITDAGIRYECLVDPGPADLEGFDPSDGPVSRGGDTECMSCGVVVESEEVQDLFRSGGYSYEIYCVKYKDGSGGYGYRSPTEADSDAIAAAIDRIESSFKISTFLSEEIPEGRKTDEPRRYGIKTWQDMYAPRQLVSQYEYARVFSEHKSDIQSSYDDTTAEAIQTLLTLGASKMAEYNCRLASWHMNKGYPDHVFKGKNFSFKRVFVDNNMSIGSMGYKSHLQKVIDSYEAIVAQVPDSAPTASVTNTDAADLMHDNASIQSVVVDPPYYSSIMYSELSDFFYVLMKEYIGQVFDSLFNSSLTPKGEEAIANPSQFTDVSSDDISKAELARLDYEQKMADIFSELYRVLEPGGVMTVMFTHKETDAWDTLTKSLIESGFIITATHPITSEMPQRAGMRQSASADTTLLLTGRKPHEEPEENPIPSLWSDVRAETREAATEAARDLLESGLSLTKTDVIISAFGPTLRVYADAYPVVNDQDEEVPPRRDGGVGRRDGVVRALLARPRVGAVRLRRRPPAGLRDRDRHRGDQTRHEGLAEATRRHRAPEPRRTRTGHRDETGEPVEPHSRRSGRLVVRPWSRRRPRGDARVRRAGRGGVCRVAPRTQPRYRRPLRIDAASTPAGPPP